MATKPWVVVRRVVVPMLTICLALVQGPAIAEGPTAETTATAVEDVLIDDLEVKTVLADEARRVQSRPLNSFLLHLRKLAESGSTVSEIASEEVAIQNNLRETAVSRHGAFRADLNDLLGQAQSVRDATDEYKSFLESAKVSVREALDKNSVPVVEEQLRAAFGSIGSASPTRIIDALGDLNRNVSEGIEVLDEGYSPGAPGAFSDASNDLLEHLEAASRSVSVAREEYRESMDHLAAADDSVERADAASLDPEVKIALQAYRDASESAQEKGDEALGVLDLTSQTVTNEATPHLEVLTNAMKELASYSPSPEYWSALDVVQVQASGLLDEFGVIEEHSASLLEHLQQLPPAFTRAKEVLSDVVVDEPQRFEMGASQLNTASEDIVDQITDTEVFQNEVAPSLNDVLDNLVVEATSLPPQVWIQLFGDTPPGALWTLYGQVLQAALNFYESQYPLIQVHSALDTVVESSIWDNPSFPGDPSGCQINSQDGVYVYKGTNGANSCVGTPHVDIFWMRGGNDYAYGARKHDVLHMGSSYDEGHGVQGPDYEYGGNTEDKLWGGEGKDWLEDNYPGDGDTFYGGPGSDDGDMKDGDIDDAYYMGLGADRDPKLDKQWACYTGGCKWDRDHLDKGP